MGPGAGSCRQAGGRAATLAAPLGTRSSTKAGNPWTSALHLAEAKPPSPIHLPWRCCWRRGWRTGWAGATACRSIRCTSPRRAWPPAPAPSSPRCRPARPPGRLRAGVGVAGGQGQAGRDAVEAASLGFGRWCCVCGGEASASAQPAAPCRLPALTHPSRCRASCSPPCPVRQGVRKGGFRCVHGQLGQLQLDAGWQPSSA